MAVISDEVFDGMGAEELAGDEGDALVAFAADRSSMVGGEKTLTVVDRNQEPGWWFRVVLREAWGVENNLRLANMDFAEFARAVDAHGCSASSQSDPACESRVARPGGQRARRRSGGTL